MRDPVQDVKHWWLVIEDGERTYSLDLSVSGRELLMNRDPEAKRQLLGARFDNAVVKLREWFLTHA